MDKAMRQNLFKFAKLTPFRTFNHEQRRHAGGLSVKKNEFVEEWALRRERVDEQFQFDQPTVVALCVTLVLIPSAIYKGIVENFHKSDDLAGRERKQFWAS